MRTMVIAWVGDRANDHLPIVQRHQMVARTVPGCGLQVHRDLVNQGRLRQVSLWRSVFTAPTEAQLDKLQELLFG